MNTVRNSFLSWRHSTGGSTRQKPLRGKNKAVINHRTPKAGSSSNSVRCGPGRSSGSAASARRLLGLPLGRQLRANPHRLLLAGVLPGPQAVLQGLVNPWPARHPAKLPLNVQQLVKNVQVSSGSSWGLSTRPAPRLSHRPKTTCCSAAYMPKAGVVNDGSRWARRKAPHDWAGRRRGGGSGGTWQLQRDQFHLIIFRAFSPSITPPGSFPGILAILTRRFFQVKFKCPFTDSLLLGERA